MRRGYDRKIEPGELSSNIVPGSLGFLPGGESLAATTLQTGSMGCGTFYWHLDANPQRFPLKHRIQ
jgi:hypothetical protein